MNVAERCDYWARWIPEHVAIREGSEDLTWAAMGDRVARVAGGLEARGVEPGDRVGILASNSTAWCVLAIAVMHRGGVVVPLNIRLAPPELRMILEHSGCSVVAYDETFAGLYEAANGDDTHRTTVSLDDRAPAGVTVSELATADPSLAVDRDRDDAAVLGYTSGTTGLPKGVVLTHANIVACALQTAHAESSMFERRTLLCIPLAFTGGIVNNFLSTYVVGGLLVLEPTFVPDRVVELIASERITTWFAVPVMWQALVGTEAFADADLSSLTTAICGGAPVPGALLEAFHAKGVSVRQAYGITEATGSACLLPAAFAHRTAAAGFPNIDTQIRLLDDEGVEVPTGDVGEIVIKGPQVMREYWNDPAATEAALPDGWLRTGDLARFDEEGLVYVVDRKKSMFISGGLNVYPAEIERIVDNLPDVAECAAFGLQHERWGEACAIVVRGASGAVDEDALLAHCREQLADYKVPRTVFHTDAPLPRGMSGKILRNEIQDAYGEVSV
ncbi:class I adenylate-forming enzyme family protein [Patulibacter minatonensis]|uniref:class I adenylate-forming enzyme family protein n=1 Tax=Patulibacter minatonensis TaxID=298163 RepID=UPI00047B92F6|nr:AMP-binding protein [Patulibacter minatonensis]